MNKTVEQLRDALTKAVQAGNADEALKIAEELRAAPRGAEKVYLINLSNTTPVLSTNYGHYWVRGRKGGADYGITEIGSRIDRMDIGDNKHIAVHLSAEEIGRDLERMANGDVGDGNSFCGVFLSYTPAPSDSDITANRAKYIAQCKEWAVMGDNIWAQGHNYALIADYMRRAVKELRLEKEWAYDPQEMNDCPGCGQKVSPKAAVCSHCFAVLDEKKARQLYPDRFPTKQTRAKRQKPEAQATV